MVRPACAAQNHLVGYQPLPLDLVATLPELPFPIYLQREGRMVLYAMPGADPRAILAQARAGLEVHIPTNDPGALRHLLLAMFARALESRSESMADRGRRSVALAVALLEPLFGPERRIEPEALVTGQAAVDLLSRALAVDPALARAIIGGHGSSGGPGRTSSEAPRFARRALDGLACAIALATTLDPAGFGAEGAGLLDLGRGVAFRDLGLPRLGSVTAGRRTRAGPGASAVHRHPVLGVELLAAALGSTPRWAALVAGHHERLDGSGYPDGRRGHELSRPVRIAGLADTFASLIAPEAWGGVRTAGEAIGVLRYGAHGRFGDDLVGALVEVLESGLLLPLRRAGMVDTTH